MVRSERIGPGVDARPGPEVLAMSAPGHVYLAGAGPGDPGLVTVATVRALEHADVVLYDALVASSLLGNAPSSAELIYVGKRSRDHSMKQEDIEALIVERAMAGQSVVRLKGGDPFVFGRGGEEALACRRAGVPFTVIPGISSALAAPAYAGIPITHRGMAESFLLVTASGRDGREPNWTAAAAADSIAVLMGRERLSMVCERLIEAGKAPETPAATIRWGTRADQQVVTGTLATLAERVEAAGLTPPVVTVVGEVAGLANEIAWFEPGPLGGKRVVVTRAREQASELADRFRTLGAMVVEAPVIKATLRTDDPELVTAVQGRWDWLMVTSASGVRAYFGALENAGLDARQLAGVRVGAIGDATAAELRRFGIRADFVPSKATAERLAAEAPLEPGARVLYPVSALADDAFTNQLRARGAEVDAVVAYENAAQPLDGQQEREVVDADAVTFTSASTARNLRAALADGEDLANARLVSIGPRTSEAVRESFGRVDREAAIPSLDSLVEATLEVLS